MKPMPEPFAGPRLKIERAKHHINDLNRKVAITGESSLYQLTIHRNPQTGNDLLDIEIHQIRADNLSPIIGDVLHNLKAALDITVNEVVHRRLGIYDDFTRFPVRETRDALVAATNGGKIKEASKEVTNFIVDVIKPYKGGNDAIWELHNLNILDKHRLLLPVFDMNLINGVCVQDERGKKHVVESWLTKGRNVSRTEVIGCVNGKITNRGQASFLVLFGEGSPLDGHPIIPTLHHFTKVVSSVVEDIERIFLTEGQG
jgi:hypothetical protein